MKRLIALLLALLSLVGCSPRPPAEVGGTLHILATTYPVYLFTTAVTEGVDGVEVSLLVNAQTSCLHDYTLTVGDMKAIESADVIVQNGGGLEDFMDAALAHSDAAVIDCSAGIKLLPTLEHADHDGHDHAEEYDPHFWMDPNRAAVMVDNIAAGLKGLDSAQADTYQMNASQTKQALQTLTGALYGVPIPLITFHDGFQYFADAFGFPLLKSIEEEEGATASAAEIKEVVELIESYHDEAYPLTAIFTEKNGSTASAKVIARETGCKIYELDMLMSGNGYGIQPYLDTIAANFNIVLDTLRERRQLHDLS